MLRTIHQLLSISGLICLTAFRSGDPYQDYNPLIYNTTIAHIFDNRARTAPVDAESGEVAEPDTATRAHVLMLDYSTYGGAYTEKIRGIIGRYLPRTVLSDFRDGNADDLNRALSGCEVVVIAYPSSAAGGVRQYNKILSQYVQQGGVVVFTGTHEYEVLQQFGLFDLDYGYFSKDRPIHSQQPMHPLFQGVSAEFSMSNFTYPLDISDSGFLTLADVGGYPVIGVKPSGSGKVIYLGMEYYFDEGPSSRLLSNAIAWSVAEAHQLAAHQGTPKGLVKRSEETLYAGSGLKAEQLELKVYPNPYFSKATLDLELSKPSPLMIDMTDELGRNVAVILPQRTVGPGLCRFDLPNIAPGIYFLQVQLGDKKFVRKVVKSASN